MDFAERIRKLSEQVTSNKEYATSEENTKQYLVLPFIRALQYDDTNPSEVDREYTLDWGVKEKDRVDYAIKRDDKAIMLIECKKFGLTLNRSRGSQLSRYFTADKDARIGILTDGATYKFFSDLDSDNRMDETPFFQFNTQEFTDMDVSRLEMFTKPMFNLDDIVQEAKRTKSMEAVKAVIAKELSNPSEEFTNHLLRLVDISIDEENPGSLVKDAMREVVQEYREGLATDKPFIPSLETAKTEPIEPVQPQVSTGAELPTDQLHRIVKGILENTVNVNLIQIKDGKTELSLSLVNNSLRGKTRRLIKLGKMRGGGYNLQFTELEKSDSGRWGKSGLTSPERIYDLDELYDHADAIRERAVLFYA